MDLQLATTQNQTSDARSVLHVLRHRIGMKLDAFGLAHGASHF